MEKIKSPKGWSRREFLDRGIKAAAVGALASSLNACIPEPENVKFNPRYVKDIEAAGKKQSIEREFNVTLTTFAEEWEKTTGMVMVPDHPDLEFKWDTEQLKWLKTYLKLLPAHFIQPINNQKLNFRLFGWGHGAGCSCFPDFNIDTTDPLILQMRTLFGSNNDTVDIGSLVLKDEHKKHGLSVLAHELTHRVQPKRLRKDADPRFPAVAQLESEWYPEIDVILGGSFLQRRHEIYSDIKALNPDVNNMGNVMDDVDINNLNDPQTKDFFLYEIAYGLGYEMGRDDKVEKYNYPIEFIAVVGDHYTQGREKFLKIYSMVMPHETAVGLYEFAKSRIYQGKEYKEFPIK